VANSKPKRKPKPRPPKPPIKPLRQGQKTEPGIGPVTKRLVGQFIVEWSNLEAALDDMIWRILGLDEEDGRTLTKRSDAATKITVLRAIAPRHLEGEILESLLDTLDVADAMRDDRNFVAHGVWGMLQPDNVPLAMSLRPKSAPNEIVAESFPHERLRQLASDTKNAKDALVRIWEKLAS